MRLAVPCLLILLSLPAAAAELHQATRVINGKSFVIETGDTVRLAGIEAPNCDEKADGTHPARPGEPLGEEARHALEELLAGRRIRIESLPNPRDRHRRLIGQVHDETGRWIQADMLGRGFAMVYSFPDDRPEEVALMLAAEREARAAKRGLWAHPYYRTLKPEETQEFINRFKLVEGKVVSVHAYHGHTYLNFSERWKGNFAVFIANRHAAAFASLDLPSLVGKTVRVRGWIHYHNAPMIDLTHPAQIEIE